MWSTIARTDRIRKLRRKTSTAVRMTEAHADNRDAGGALALARLKSDLSAETNRNRDSKIL